MEKLFNEIIQGWPSWGRVYQHIPSWRRLIEHIFATEGLRFTAIDALTPGTNAVFKVGPYVIKLFAPLESGIDPTADFNTEQFGIKRTESLGIPTPRLIASGCQHDRYDFYYLITEFIDAKSFTEASINDTESDKVRFGQKLRTITDRLNTECVAFNAIDPIKRAVQNRRWDVFPQVFNTQRIEYLTKLPPEKPVYVHGDLNPDNLLIKGDTIYLIDFADALLAPRRYELAAIFFELFEPVHPNPYLQGYFGEVDIERLSKSIFDAVLMHDFGAGMIQQNLGNAADFSDLSVLSNRIADCIK